MTLVFDVALDSLVIDGVRIGKGTTSGDVDGRIPGKLSAVPGHRDYLNFDGRLNDLLIGLAFRGGALESGTISVSRCRAGERESWEEHDQNEAWRRTQHERMMLSMFGKPEYESDALFVYMVREPHNQTEKIRIVTQS